MGRCNCNCTSTCQCKAIAVIVALIFAFIAGVVTFFNLLGVTIVASAALIIGLIALGILLLFSFFKGYGQTGCLCSHLAQLLVGILGTIFTAILTLVFGPILSLILGVIFVALIAFFFVLALVTFVCLIICLTDCSCNR